MSDQTGSDDSSFEIRVVSEPASMLPKTKEAPWSNSEFWFCPWVDEVNFLVFIRQDVKQQIVEHSLETPLYEIGGVLMGDIYQTCRGVRFMEITGAIPALEGERRQISFTFTADSWATILTRAADEYSEDRIVGWYHSHPGFGAYFSSADVFIHHNFFKDDHVALVVDPQLSEGVFFAKLETTPPELGASVVFSWGNSKPTMPEVADLSNLSDILQRSLPAIDDERLTQFRLVLQDGRMKVLGEYLRLGCAILPAVGILGLLFLWANFSTGNAKLSSSLTVTLISLVIVIMGTFVLVWLLFLYGPTVIGTLAKLSNSALARKAGSVMLSLFGRARKQIYRLLAMRSSGPSSTDADSTVDPKG